MSASMKLTAGTLPGPPESLLRAFEAGEAIRPPLGATQTLPPVF